jgi:anti-anti-sigma regulatory factor
MTISIERVGDVAVVDLGSWESTTLEAWTASEPFELLRQGKRRFVFDLRSCAYVGSGILAELVAFYRSCREVEAAAVVVATAAQSSVFELTKLDMVLEVFDSVDEAVASFDRDGA